jgi:signal transduction histidine kinase
MHRGQITVNSQAGKGTTFTVTLPVRPSRNQALPSALNTEFTV